MAGIVCGELDISLINEDELIAISGAGAWVGFDVDEKIYEIIGSPYAYAVLKFNSPCWASVCADDSSNLVNQAFLMISNSLNNTILSSGSENPNVSNNSTDLPGSGIPAETICGVNISLLQQAQQMVDSLQSNEKGFQPVAVKPNACVIPMRSNVFSYGPWASSNFATTYGGAELQVNNDLAPWLFGSSTAMINAGQELANTSIIGLSRAEKGSITLTGLPKFGIGYVLANGPTLTNLSVDLGSSGATTTYDFATYTPKFGQLSRAIIERYKNMHRIRNEQLRFLRQSQIDSNKISRKTAASNINTYNRGEMSKSLSDKNSLSRVLVGEVFDFQNTLNGGVGQRTIVGLSTLSKSTLEMRGNKYANKAFMSLDGLYGPVSISGDGGLPRFIQRVEYEGSSSGIGWTNAPQPPILKESTDTQNLLNSITNDPNSSNLINNELNIISIHKDYLNPLANPSSIPYHLGNHAGHSIETVGRGTGALVGGLMTNFYRPSDSGKYSDDYRFLGMRGPIVLHSWGYDTDGRPVPNASDTEEQAKSGIFEIDNLKNEFMNDWLQKPSTWPVAPIDLRLDRERGVWVTPREHKIVTVELPNGLTKFSSASGRIINERSGEIYGKPITNEDGDLINSDSYNIIVTDRVGMTASSGLFYAYFDTFTNKYLLLNNSKATTTIIYAIAYGAWSINSIKALTPAIWSDFNLIEGSGIIHAHNSMVNISRTDKYVVALVYDGNDYMYLSGGVS